MIPKETLNLQTCKFLDLSRRKLCAMWTAASSCKSLLFYQNRKKLFMWRHKFFDFGDSHLLRSNRHLLLSNWAMDEDRIGLILGKTSELRSRIINSIRKSSYAEEQGKESESKELEAGSVVENREDDNEEEMESLLNIKDALESLEGQLSSLQVLLIWVSFELLEFQFSVLLFAIVLISGWFLECKSKQLFPFLFGVYFLCFLLLEFFVVFNFCADSRQKCGNFFLFSVTLFVDNNWDIIIMMLP